MKIWKFGIIGCGLMGKEFAGAAGRWSQLNEAVDRPEIVAVCDSSPEAMAWFKERLPGVKYAFADYRDLLACEEIEAVYCAVPHYLHQQIYVDIIRAHKHLLGEKPFGIDQRANAAIVRALRENPGVIARCASEFPYFPACQALISRIRENCFGRIIEASAGLNHSSDMDLNKPLNWKRRIETNGAYGCIGDLGIHTEHVPFRMGWKPLNVFAKLSNLVTERPDGRGGAAPCDTWDNALLVCDMQPPGGPVFPMTFEMKRMKPGATNDWYLEVHGLNGSARFSTNDPNALYYTQAVGKEQAWCRLDIGSKPLFSTVTAPIFEFGFTDAMLQMWAAFIWELSGKQVGFGCFTPRETQVSHALHTAALASQASGQAIAVQTDFD